MYFSVSQLFLLFCIPGITLIIGSKIIQSYAGEGSYWCNGLSRFLVEGGSHLKHVYAQEQVRI